MTRVVVFEPAARRHRKNLAKAHVDVLFAGLSYTALEVA
jgi:hypothetical protein